MSEEKQNIINIQAGAADGSTSSVELAKTTGQTKIKVKIYGDPDESAGKCKTLFDGLLVAYPDGE